MSNFTLDVTVMYMLNYRPGKSAVNDLGARIVQEGPRQARPRAQSGLPRFKKRHIAHWPSKRLFDKRRGGQGGRRARQSTARGAQGPAGPQTRNRRNGARGRLQGHAWPYRYSSSQYGARTPPWGLAVVALTDTHGDIRQVVR